MGLSLPKEMAKAIGIGQTFPHFRLFGFYLRAVIVIVWQSVGGVYQDRRSVTHFVFTGDGNKWNFRRKKRDWEENRETCVMC